MVANFSADNCPEIESAAMVGNGLNEARNQQKQIDRKISGLPNETTSRPHGLIHGGRQHISDPHDRWHTLD